MLKKEVTYWGFRDGEEVERATTVRFHFTPKALKLYEDKTNGRKLLADVKEIAVPLTKFNGKEDQSEMVAVAFDSKITDFLMDAIPALYLKIDGDRGIQNDQTFEEAQASDWIPELLNLFSLMDIVQEITAGQSKQVKDTKGKK